MRDGAVFEYVCLVKAFVSRGCTERIIPDAYRKCGNERVGKFVFQTFERCGNGLNVSAGIVMTTRQAWYM